MESLSQLVICEIPRSFERSSPSNFRTQGSFIHINCEKLFERDLLSSDSVAKSTTQKPLTLGFLRLYCSRTPCGESPSITRRDWQGEDSDVDFEASRRSTRVQSKSTIRSALFLAKH